MGQRQIIISQSSLTYAYKGQSVLTSNGISVQIVRLSAERTQRGCGYGLSVPEGQLQRALLILRQAGAYIGEIVR